MAILLKPRVDVRPFHSFLKLKSFYELDFFFDYHSIEDYTVLTIGSNEERQNIVKN